MVSLADLSVSRKLAYGFTAIVAVMVAVSASSWHNLSKTSADNDLTEHSYQALGAINLVSASLIEEENSLRGYLLSGDAASLEPYRKARIAYGEAMAKTKEIFTSPDMIASLGDLGRAAESWQTEVADKEIALAADPAGLEDARKMDASGLGKKRLESVRAIASKMREVIIGRLKTRTENADQSLSLAYWVVALGLLISVGLAASLSIVLAKAIADPIKAMTRAMTALARGDKSITIPALDRRDEVGQMAGAVQIFKENMLRADQSSAEQDAKRHADEVRAKSLLTLATEFDRSISSSLDAVSAAAGDLQATAGNLTNTAEITTSQSAVVTSAANEASSNVQTVAAAAEELSSSINEISRQVSHSARIAGEAVAEADRTNAVVRGLADAAGRIGDVVNLINDIAAQTNLLALNATIEAARAGDAGKGFAVVANEVKTLANQTAKATGEITGQISAVQSATKDAVQAIQGIGSTIGQINEIATTIATAVEEQGAATQEIARNVQQAAFGTQEVTVNIAGVSEAAIETGNSAHDVLNSSTTLSREANQLKGVVQTFLQNLRSA